MEVSLCVALHLSITLPIRDASDGPVICSGIAPSSYTDIMVHDGASISDRRRRLDRVPLHCTALCVNSALNGRGGGFEDAVAEHVSGKSRTTILHLLVE